MTYNDQQFEALAKFEGAFVSAIQSNYASNPGTEQLKLIRATYIAATGARNVPEDYGCSACVIRLLRKAGRLWLLDRDERNDAKLSADAAKEPATEPSTPAPDTNTTQTVKAAKTAPKSKTAKK